MVHYLRESDLLEVSVLAKALTQVTRWEELVECSLLHLAQLVLCESIAWSEQNSQTRKTTCIHVLKTSSNTTRLQSFMRTNLTGYKWTMSPQENIPRKAAYRQSDARYQFAYAFATTSSAELLVTIHRQKHDFSERERTLLKLACNLIEPHARSIHQREDSLEKALILAKLIEERYGLVNIETLSPGEISLLKELASGMNVSAIARSKHVRRDTVSRQLSVARKKLGIDSNKELLSALR